MGGSFLASGSFSCVSDFWDGSDEGSDFFAGSPALAAKLPAKMSMSELSAGHSGGFCKKKRNLLRGLKYWLISTLQWRYFLFDQ